MPFVPIFKHQCEPALWQVLERATHLLGEAGDGAGAGGAMRSLLSTDSACDLETSATVKQGRCFVRASGACVLMDRLKPISIPS